MEDFAPVLNRIDKRLAGCSTLLSQGGKLTLIKSVFTSLPAFYMSTLTLPKGIIEQINRYLKHCFWRKYEMEDKGTALIKWEKVCKPKKYGGLVVINLQLQNKCIQMKFIHK